MKKAVLGVCLGILLAFTSVRAQGGLDQRVSELSQQIATKMTAKQKTTIAVVEFTDLQGNVSDFGRFLAEELVTRLGDLEKFKVIERQLLTKIIAEQKLSLTGVVDPASAKQLGKILGVDAIISGSVTNLAQSVRVNARLISTETGEVFATAAADIFKDESVTGLLSVGSGPSTAKSTPQRPESTKSNPRKITVREFSFELESCRLSAGGVVCSLTITNNGLVDREVSFSAGHTGPQASRMIDEFGGEYLVKKTELGSRTTNAAYHSVSNSLVSQIPVKLRLIFDTVNQDAKTVTLLRVVFQLEDSNRVNLNTDFRNIPITK